MDFSAYLASSSDNEGEEDSGHHDGDKYKVGRHGGVVSDGGCGFYLVGLVMMLETNGLAWTLIVWVGVCVLRAGSGMSEDEVDRG